MNNTKLRHSQIYAASVAAIQSLGGVEAIDKLPLDDRHTVLSGLYSMVIAETVCHRDTAKRNVAKAMRRVRYAEMVEHGWGGARPGPHPGRPKKTQP